VITLFQSLVYLCLNQRLFKTGFLSISGRLPSAGLTIVENVAIATGPALLGASRSSAIYRLYYIMYKIFFGPRSQYFATFAVSGKQGFSIERCLFPENLVCFFSYS